MAYLQIQRQHRTGAVRAGEHAVKNVQPDQSGADQNQRKNSNVAVRAAAWRQHLGGDHRLHKREIQAAQINVWPDLRSQRSVKINSVKESCEKLKKFKLQANVIIHYSEGAQAHMESFDRELVDNVKTMLHMNYQMHITENMTLNEVDRHFSQYDSYEAIETIKYSERHQNQSNKGPVPMEIDNIVALNPNVDQNQYNMDPNQYHYTNMNPNQYNYTNMNSNQYNHTSMSSNHYNHISQNHPQNPFRYNIGQHRIENEEIFSGMPQGATGQYYHCHSAIQCWDFY